MCHLSLSTLGLLYNWAQYKYDSRQQTGYHFKLKELGNTGNCDDGIAV